MGPLRAGVAAVLFIATACTAVDDANGPVDDADAGECARFADVQEEYLVRPIESPLSSAEVSEWFEGRRNAYDRWTEAARSELEPAIADEIAFVSEVETARAQFVVDRWDGDGASLQRDADRFGFSIEALWPIDGLQLGDGTVVLRDEYGPRSGATFEEAGLRCAPIPESYVPLEASEDPAALRTSLAGVRDDAIVGVSGEGDPQALGTGVVDIYDIEASPGGRTVLVETSGVDGAAQTTVLGDPIAGRSDERLLPWSCPAYSPSGASIAMRAGSETVDQLIVMEVGTGESDSYPEVDASAPYPAGCVSFVSETEIVASERNAQSRVVLVRLDLVTREKVVIYENDACNAVYPDVSPDGAQVALGVGCANPRESGILIVDLADGDTRVVANGSISRPKWSPDGEWIAFAAKRPDAQPELDVWVIRPDGADAQIVIEDADWPAWVDLSLFVDE